MAKAIVEEKTRIIDIDLSAYFDNVQHSLLLEKVAQRIKDGEVMHLLKMIVKATGKKGVPQGGVISPLLSKQRVMLALSSLRPKTPTVVPRSFLRLNRSAVIVFGGGACS